MQQPYNYGSDETTTSTTTRMLRHTTRKFLNPGVKNLDLDLEPRVVMPVTTVSPTTKNVFTSMWVGAVSGMGGISAVYPVDVVKTRMQNGSGSQVTLGAVQIVRNMLASEGLRSFYKGLTPQLCGTIPDKAVSLATREFVRNRFHHSNDFVVSLVSASCAGLMQSIVMNPVEIVKVRMQLDSKLQMLNVIRDLGVSGMYRGYSACVQRDILFAALYFSIYDSTKRKLGVQDGSSLSKTILAGTLAGIPAAFISTPLDTIKTRMQAAVKSGSAGVKPLGFVQTASSVYAAQGLKGLYAGWQPRVARIAPQFGIVLVSYDYLMHRVEQQA